MEWQNWVLLCLLCATFVSCDVYDPERLETNLDNIGKVDSSYIKPKEDAAKAKEDTGVGVDASDAGDLPPESNCIPNPQNDPLCPEICPELCNGKDDDCDSETDEDEASSACFFSHAIAKCEMGRCVIAECQKGFDNCDNNEMNGCEKPVDTVSACGSCDKRCGELDNARSVRCVDGECKAFLCQLGYGDCDEDAANGCETRVDSMTNCGACNIACELSSCAGGRCTSLDCEDGFGDCDGDETNGCETALNSVTDCVVCGKTCSYPNSTASCESGVCEHVKCKSGLGDCNSDLEDGCETDLNTLINCGACGEACKTDETCVGGTCTGQECESGMGDCDGDSENGCETPLNTDENCGICDAVCTSVNSQEVNCNTETLTCEVQNCIDGYYDCDEDPENGCESQLKDDLNCGACQQPCSRDNAMASCATGSCELVGCNPPFEDCNGNPDDGCEAEIGKRPNCSECGDACGDGTICSEGQCIPGCIQEECPVCNDGLLSCCNPDLTCGCLFFFCI